MRSFAPALLLLALAAGCTPAPLGGFAPGLRAPAAPAAGSEGAEPAPGGLVTGSAPGGAGPGAAGASSEAAFPPADTPVPVLMYHVIGTPRGPWPDLYVRPRDFAAQMAFLRDHGFRTLTLAQLLDAWAGRRPMPAHPVVVTFDDGYASAVTEALPVLRRNGQHATLFLQLGLLGRPGAVTPAMVREWLAAGDELGDHTITHPDLRRVSDDRLRREIVDSKAQLEADFGARVRTFAYPSGEYDERTVAVLRAAGFEAAATTRYGLARPDEPFALRRVRVSGSDGLRGFVQKLAALLGGLPPARNGAGALPR